MNEWNIQSQYKEGENLVEQLLRNREIDNIEEFLQVPSLTQYVKNLQGEFINNLKSAVKIIKEAVDSRDNIIIYGDYDADGICSASILYSYFINEAAYKNVSYFIPNRFDHGYGLSRNGIDAVLKKEGLEGSENVLWITVDTGITSFEEVNYLKSIGHKVVLTDHHQKPDILPEPDVILWTDKVVGSSISWLLSRALGSKNSETIEFAALATVTDLQPLIGFNRAIVKYGLEKMNQKAPLGLEKLIKISGRSNGEITTYDLGWIIGPRINALGRMGDADEAVELILSKDDEHAHELAKKLNNINVRRQDKTFEMYELADNIDDTNLPHIIFSHDEEYHEGIIGLVAARLVQKYYRPSIVISLDGEYGKGSVRSIPGVNIIKLLREFEDLFENVGGHPMAAGFTIRREKIQVLEDKVLAYAAENISGDLFVPIIDIDMEIPSEIVNLDLLNDLEKLKPFGMANSQPIFLSKDIGVVGVDWVGRDKNHLSIKLYDGSDFRKAIFFNAGDQDLVPQIGDKVDVVYSLKKNEYRGKTYIDFVVKDMRISASIDS